MTLDDAILAMGIAILLVMAMAYGLWALARVYYLLNHWLHR